MIDWSDLLAALGLAAVIEGAVYAIAPEATKRWLSEFFALPVEMRRAFGLGICGLGVVLVWFARG